MDNDTKDFIREQLSYLQRMFGVTGTVPSAGEFQPGALEVLADAIGQGNFGGTGLGSSIEEAAETIKQGAQEIASAIDNLADAIRETNK